MTETTGYWQRPDGGLITVTGVNAPPTPPDGATEIPQALHDTELAVIVEAREEARAVTKAAEAETAETAYLALVGVGLPTAVAELLSGHRPLDE